MFEWYTESARRALFFARYEASELGSIAIETEHMLLGLIRESKGLVARLLAMSQISSDNPREDIKSGSVFREKIATSVEIPFTAGTKRVLQFAAEEADRLSHCYIGTEHLFLGLLRERHSVAASLLTKRGLRADDVRNTIVKLLAESPTASTSWEVADVSAQIDHIKQWVEQLAGMPSDSSEAHALVDRIRESLDAVKRDLAK